MASKTGGRQKGTPNKLSGQAKENIQAVFTRIGGTAAMAKWAKANQSQFYAIYSKLVPHELTGAGGGAIELHVTGVDAGVL